MKSFRFLTDRWPLVCLALVTALVVIWAGVMVHEVTAPSPDPAQVSGRPLTSATVPSATGSIPAWVKTAPPLAVPSPSATSPLPYPSVLPSQSVLPQPSSSLLQPSPSLVPSTSLPLAAPSAPRISAPDRVGAGMLPQARYGHLPYAEAPQERLVSIGTYGEGNDRRTEYLDRDAATAFRQMVEAAKAEGVSIVPISGFRTVAQQEKLFERQIRRQGSASAAATLSAPPGYSEHHTGYALDIGDGARPQTDVKFEFEDTVAYRWMAANAKRYGFELSYPRDNVQGVSFEPWHWRFIQSSQASAVFSVAHTLRP
jgi:zinc D-Ala-D-Ala carboxypeptidase